jgi:hypothetical protein
MIAEWPAGAAKFRRCWATTAEMARFEQPIEPMTLGSMPTESIELRLARVGNPQVVYDWDRRIPTCPPE